MTLLQLADLGIIGLIFVLTFVHPWILKRGQGSRAVGLPLFVTLAWGLWHVAYVDLELDSDVPGAGYIFAALMFAFVAGMF